MIPLLPLTLLMLLLYAAASSRRSSVLVIVNGQLRGGPLAWASFQDKVLDFYGADLALIGPPFDERDNDTFILRDRATYIWTYPDFPDWGSPIDAIYNDSSWRALCDAKSFHKDPTEIYWQFLGGIRNCNHSGSAGILLAYRQLALQSLSLPRDSLVDKYDWFVYTRSDYLYICYPPPLSRLSPLKINVPYAEGYGGITDRLSYIPRHLVLRVLNMTAHIAFNWKRYTSIKYLNLEILLSRYMSEMNIGINVFAHTAFTVRRNSDSTKWSKGGERSKFSRKYGLLIKYHKEFKEAEKNCDSWEQFDNLYLAKHISNITELSVVTTYRSNAFYLFANKLLHKLPGTLFTPHPLIPASDALFFF